MRPPAARTIRIGTGNVDSGNDAPNQAVTTAERTGSHLWGWQEGKNIARLTQGPNYRDLTANGMGFDIKGDANDCVMQIRKDLEVCHFSMTKVCDAIEDSKVAHARTFSMIGIDLPWLDEPFYYVNIHPNWIVKINGGRILEEYVKSVHGFNAMMGMVRKITPYYAIGGDFNIPKQAAFKRKHDTHHAVCNDLRMTSKGYRLDYIYISRDLKFVDWHKIPSRITGSDHKFWLVGDVKPV